MFHAPAFRQPPWNQRMQRWCWVGLSGILDLVRLYRLTQESRVSCFEGSRRVNRREWSCHKVPAPPPHPTPPLSPLCPSGRCPHSAPVHRMSLGSGLLQELCTWWVGSLQSPHSALSTTFPFPFHFRTLFGSLPASLEGRQIAVLILGSVVPGKVNHHCVWGGCSLPPLFSP